MIYLSLIMSKKSAIDKANKRLLNESMPPRIYFSEYEVADMLCEVTGCNDRTQMSPKAVEILQKALIKKGRNLNPPNVPDGAYL